MPWIIRRRDQKFCVFKEGADGEPVGEARGCHATDEEAKAQQAALYVHADGGKSGAVKFADGSEDGIEGLLAPFGGPFNGSDIQGERFSAKTDFCLGWFSERPLLYHHGLDAVVGTAVVGRIKTVEIRDDVGLWMKAQLDKGSKYYAAIRELIAKGALQLSSGAMGHLAKVSKTGDILKWPLVEGTLTPTPANPMAMIDFATAKAHFKAIDIDIDLDSVKAVLEAAAREALDTEDYAYIDSGGGRHLPMNDAVHARNALARFNQTQFEDGAAKTKAWRRLVARCKELGVEVSDGKALVGSYEELVERLNAAINPHNPFAPADRYAYVQSTFADHFIARLHEGGEKSAYQVEYSTDDDGTVILGMMSPVEESPEVEAAGLVPERLAEHTELVTAYASALTERTRDLGERRLKEGRVISAATRTRLTSCVTAMRSAVEELTAFLESTDVAKAEAKAALGKLSVDVDLLELETALFTSA